MMRLKISVWVNMYQWLLISVVVCICSDVIIMHGCIDKCCIVWLLWLTIWLVLFQLYLDPDSQYTQAIYKNKMLATDVSLSLEIWIQCLSGLSNGTVGCNGI